MALLFLVEEVRAQQLQALRDDRCTGATRCIVPGPSPSPSFTPAQLAAAEAALNIPVRECIAYRDSEIEQDFFDDSNDLFLARIFSTAC